MSAAISIGRTLYVAKSGCVFAAWWDLAPPPFTKTGKCPKYRAPDVWHDRAVGDEEAVVTLMVQGRVIEQPAHISYLPPEWAHAGLEAGIASKRKKRVKPPNPEGGGLFAPEFLKPVQADAGIDAARARMKPPRKKRGEQ